MPDIVVSTTFRAKDKVTAAFERMSKGADRFGTRADKAFKKASKGAGRFGDIVKGIVTVQVLNRAMRGLQTGVRSVVSEFIDFDDAITAAAVKFGMIKRGSKVFKELQGTAREVGATTEFSSAQAAAGLRFLAKAGYEPAFAMKSLRGFVDLATASEMEFAEAADIASDVMGAFQLNTKDTTQRLANLNRVNDVMSKAVNMSNIDLQDLFETIKDAGPVATAAGIDLEKFGAMAAFVGGAGIKGTKGGTALKTMVFSLAAPTGKARKLFRSLNIELEDSNRNLRDPIILFGELQKKMKGMGTAQRAAALEVLFGRRAVAGASVSIAGGTEALKEFEDKLKNSKGAASEMATEMRKSIGKRLEALKSSAIEVGFKFIDAFEDQIPRAIEAATQAVRGFNVKEAIQGLKAFWLKIKNVKQLISDLSPIIAGVVGAMAAYKAVMLASAAASAIATAAQWALNVAMTANPIGIVIVAIGALIAGIVLLVKNWDAVKAAFGRAVDFFKIGIDKIWNWFSGMLDNPFFRAISTIFLPFISIPAQIVKHWEPIKKFFIALWGGIKDTFSVVIDWISGKIKWVADKVKWVTDKIKGVFDKVGSLSNSVAGFFGFGEDERKSPPRVAPNETELERERVKFEGKITLAGAPEGTTFESETFGAPPIQTEMLGENP